MRCENKAISILFLFWVLAVNGASGPKLFNGPVSRALYDALFIVRDQSLPGIRILEGERSLAVDAAGGETVLRCEVNVALSAPNHRYLVNNAVCEFSIHFLPGADPKLHGEVSRVLVALLKNAVTHRNSSPASEEISLKGNRQFERYEVGDGSVLLVSQQFHHRILCEVDLAGGGRQADCQLHFLTLGDSTKAAQMVQEVRKDPVVGAAVVAAESRGAKLISHSVRLVVDPVTAAKYPNLHTLQFTLQDLKAGASQLGSIRFEIEVNEVKGVYRVASVKQQFGYLQQIQLN